MQITPADRSVAIPAKADGAGATASAPAVAADAAVKAASEPVRAGVTQPSKDTSDYLSATQGAKGPDSPSADADTPNRDWTSTPKATEAEKQKEKEEVKPRLFELLIEQFNSLWRASTQAVDATTQSQALSQANRQSQIDNNGKSSPLVYTDPSKVRKTSSTEGS